MRGCRKYLNRKAWKQQTYNKTAPKASAEQNDQNNRLRETALTSKETVKEKVVTGRNNAMSGSQKATLGGTRKREYR